MTTSNTGLPGLDRVWIWFNDPANWSGPSGLVAHTREHIVYTLVILVAATLVAVPLGLLIGHTGRGVLAVVGAANGLRAIPSLGLLILLILELSPHIHQTAGFSSLVAPGSIPYLFPAAIVLLVLAIPPILAATYAGVASIEPAIRDAARGAGMTALQTTLRVELPCALPLVMSGVRSATLQVVASLAVAAYAPLVGGLGRLIVDGDQNLTDNRYGYPAIVAAGITVACLALIADLSPQPPAAPHRVSGPYRSPRPDHQPDRDARTHARSGLPPPPRRPHPSLGATMNRTRTLALCALTGALLTACGVSGSSSSSTSPTTRSGPSVDQSTPLPTRPGSVTIGSAGFPESELLANLYAEALRAAGVKVTVHANIGERPAYLAALGDGSIGAVPEYTGAILDYVSKGNPARSSADVYAQLQQQAGLAGWTVSNYAAAQDVDTVTVTRKTADKYHLRSIGDLRTVARTLAFGAPAPFQTVSYGTSALRTAYGVTFGRFVALSPGGSITQSALRNGTVDAADIFSTDPVIARDGLVTLDDPAGIFAAENVVLLISQKVATQPMVDAADRLNARLDTATLASLVQKVASGSESASVAREWVREQLP